MACVPTFLVFGQEEILKRMNDMSMTTGYFVDVSKSTTRRTKVHICSDSKPICGCHPKGNFQWCANYAYLGYVECKICRNKWLMTLLISQDELIRSMKK